MSSHATDLAVYAKIFFFFLTLLTLETIVIMFIPVWYLKHYDPSMHMMQWTVHIHNAAVTDRNSLQILVVYSRIMLTEKLLLVSR